MNPGPGKGWLYLLFLLSGAAALGAQMVWTQMFAAGLGHEVPAMLAVVAAFLGGMAAGAAILGRRLSTTSRPATWFGAFEILIGLWTLVAALLIPWVNEVALHLTGPTPSALRQWSVAFGLPFLFLLPATAPMGATLPAMERVFGLTMGGQRCIGGLYAANTFGAVAGILGSVFLLMPSLGFRASLFALATINIAVGGATLAWRNRIEARHPVGQLEKERPKSGPPSQAATSVSMGRLALTAFLTGCLGMGLELTGIRILSQVLENTLFTYAAALAAYLLGTALGGGLYQRFAVERPYRTVLSWLLGTAAIASLLSACSSVWVQPIYDGIRNLLGDEMGSVLMAEMAVACFWFGLPTIAMGALFSHVLEGSRSRAGGVGWAAALNTIGCSVAAVLVGLLVLPGLGLRRTMLVLAFGFLVLMPGLRGGAWVFPLGAIVLAILVPANLAWKEIPPGGIVRDYREGVMASVSVLQTPDGHRSLRVNNRLQMGGTAAALAERRQAHIPLLLHPSPRRALFLGPGTGITLGAAGVHAGLTSQGVELVPEIRDLMRFFEPENGGPFPRPGLQVDVADARRFVRTTTNRYDVIVADLFHPAQDGAGFLYTRNHFHALRQRLNPGGFFCQWLPLHQLDRATSQLIVRTFLESFSRTHAFLLHFNVDVPVLALVGTPDGLHLSVEELEQRLKASDLQPHLRGVGLERSLNLLGCFVAGPEQLRAFAGSGATGTDNWPGVLFQAPKFAVRRNPSSPDQLLLTLLRECRPTRNEFAALIGSGDAIYLGNLASFIEARDIYLQGLVAEGQGRLAEAIDSYLASARTSLHFLPAYARCVSIIQVFAKTDRDQARRLYQRLETAQPGQPLARNLFGSSLGTEEGPAR